MRGVGRAVFLIGLALSVAGALVVVALIWQILDPAAAPSGERQTVDGSVEVSLEEDERRYFFIPAEAHEDTGRDGAVETSYTPLAESNCTVEGPDAEQLPIRGARTERSEPRGPECSVRAPRQCITRRAIQLPRACANWTSTTSTTTMTATTTQSKRW